MDIPVSALSCPFCGGPGHVGPASSFAYEVRCLSCGARTRGFSLPDYSDQTLEKLEQTLMHEAVASWNKRIFKQEM